MNVTFLQNNFHLLFLSLLGPEMIGFAYFVTDSDKVLISPVENLFVRFLVQLLHNPAGKTIFETKSFFSRLLHRPHRGFPHSSHANFAVAPQFKQSKTISSFFSPIIITILLRFPSIKPQHFCRDLNPSFLVRNLLLLR